MLYPMTYDMFVLRAIARLARKGTHAEEAALVLRAGGTGADVRNALRRLELQGLARRDVRGVAHLTLAGLALTVASAPPSRARRVHRPGLRRAAPRRAAA